jgi:hypothetical protein
MLTKKEYGTIAFLYFGNLSLAKEFGFYSYEELIIEVERMKAIGRYLNTFGYNPIHSFVHTPPSYRKAHNFFFRLQSKFPKEVALLAKVAVQKEFIGVAHVKVNPSKPEGFVVEFHGNDLDMFEVLKAIDYWVNLEEGDIFTIGFVGSDKEAITYVIRNGDVCNIT